jgi:hypothetical protein
LTPQTRGGDLDHEHAGGSREGQAEEGCDEAPRVFPISRSRDALLAVLKANNPGKFRDRIEQLNIQDIDIDKLSPEVLDRLAEHLMNKALGGNPKAVAEARRQIEAGKTPAVEAIAEAIEITLEAT